MFTPYQQELLAKGESFLNLWEANVVDSFVRHTHCLHTSIVLVSTSKNTQLTLELFDREGPNGRNSYNHIPSNDCLDIPTLNLSASTVARIFADNSVYKSIFSDSGDVRLFCEGNRSCLFNVPYNLTIREIRNG